MFNLWDLAEPSSAKAEETQHGDYDYNQTDDIDDVVHEFASLRIRLKRPCRRLVHPPNVSRHCSMQPSMPDMIYAVVSCPVLTFSLDSAPGATVAPFNTGNRHPAIVIAAFSGPS